MSVASAATASKQKMVNLRTLEWCFGMPLEVDLATVRQAFGTAQEFLADGWLTRLHIETMGWSSATHEARFEQLREIGDAPGATRKELVLAAMLSPLRDVRARIVRACLTPGTSPVLRATDLEGGGTVPLEDTVMLLRLPADFMLNGVAACEQALAAADALHSELVAEYDALDYTPARTAAAIRRLQMTGAESVAASPSVQRTYAALFEPVRTFRQAAVSKTALAVLRQAHLAAHEEYPTKAAAASFAARVVVDELAVSGALLDLARGALFILNAIAFDPVAASALPPAGAIPALAEVCRQHMADHAAAGMAVDSLSRLVYAPELAAQVVAAGGIDLAVAAASLHADSQPVVAAATVMLTFAWREAIDLPDVASAVLRPQCASVMVAALLKHNDNPTIVQNATTFLAACTDVSIADPKTMFIEVGGIPAMVTALRTCGSHEVAVGIALAVLANLCVGKEDMPDAASVANALAIADAGAIPVVVSTVARHARDPAIGPAACSTLAAIASALRCSSGESWVADCLAGLPHVVTVLKVLPRDQAAFAATCRAIKALVCGEHAVKQVVSAGAVQILIAALAAGDMPAPIAAAARSALAAVVGGRPSADASPAAGGMPVVLAAKPKHHSDASVPPFAGGVVHGMADSTGKTVDELAGSGLKAALAGKDVHHARETKKILGQCTDIISESKLGSAACAASAGSGSGST